MAVLLVGAGSAAGGTASVSSGQLRYEGGNADERVSVTVVRYLASYEVRDGNGRNVVAGPGCKKMPVQSGSPKSAFCPLSSVSSILMLMKGGADDAATGLGSHKEDFVQDPITIDAGDGNDFANGATSGPRVTLLGGAGRDNLNGTPSLNAPGNPLTARGGGGKDVIQGSCGGRDTLVGGQASDTFYAKDGKKDVVKGGGGEDTASADKADEKESIEKTRSENLCKSYDPVTAR